MGQRASGYLGRMEGGIAIFLLFLIIVFGLVLALLFGGLSGGKQAPDEQPEERLPE